MSHRRTDVDVVRFLALASMYVAHVTPIPGPAHLLELSEYLTMPLFALLIGVGAQLGARSSASATQQWWSVAVRAAVLVGLGLALERAEAQVVVVLVHLGVLVVVAAVLVRLPTAAVLTAGVAAVVVERLLVERVTIDAIGTGSWGSDVALFLWAGGPYRLLVMVLYAAIGIALARWWLTGPRGRSTWLPGLVGGGLLVVAAAVLAAEQRGLVDLVPYSGTPQETVLDGLVAAGVLGVGLAAARALDDVAAARRVLVVLAAAGAMTLSLYTLQILWLAYDVRVLHPGRADDSWTNLAVLLAGSIALAWAWCSVVRRDPWRKGPLEGVLGIAIRAIR